MEYTIYIETEKLSDGSMVYNVRLDDSVFHATSEADACALAELMADAINARTVDAAEVHYG